MQHLVLEYYQVCSNYDPGLTLTYFMALSNLVPYAFVWEKVETMDFSETSVVFDIKVGRCSQVNEYMKLYEYQRSRSLIDLGLNLSDSIFLKFFSSVTTRPIEAKFRLKPPWDGETKACSNGPDHMKKMVKTIKDILSGIKRPMTLKLSMQYWVLQYYQTWSKDAAGLALTYFTARSNLVPYAFVWEKVKQWNFQKLL